LAICSSKVTIEYLFTLPIVQQKSQMARIAAWRELLADQYTHIKAEW